MIVGRSRKRGLPVFVFQNRTYAFWQIARFLKILRRARAIKRKEISENLCSANLFGYDLLLDKLHADIALDESFNFAKWYTPINLEGSIVLDVGAGNLETAVMFLQKGARKVIAIDSDPGACEISRKNVARLGINVEVICSEFNLDHLKIPHSFLKMDIEGGERELLKVEQLPRPLVVEVHGKELIDQFGCHNPSRIFEVTNNVKIMWFL
ncbi:MAG: methyltransferase domain-containing protein [Nitrososphaerota archaeon]|nr:methyltransferase domain-containing protein [Nitrososphaerota archaeon]